MEVESAISHKKVHGTFCQRVIALLKQSMRDKVIPV